MENNFCRICLDITDQLTYLFDDEHMPHKIVTISSVWVSTLDNLPSMVCDKCIQQINLFYDFRKLIIKNDLQIKEEYGDIVNRKEDDYNLTNIDAELPDESKHPIENINEDLNHHHNINNNSNGIVEKSVLKIESSNISDRNLPNCKRIYKCNICNFTTTYVTKFKNHNRTNHYPPGICSICGKEIRSDNLNKHVTAHNEKPIPCVKCGKVFKNSESLRAHTVFHTGQEYQCETCFKTYKCRGEYNRHLKTHTLNGVRTVKCTECDKMFFNKKQARRHLQTHSHERPHICQYCAKGFSSRYALKTHIIQHTKENPFICEYCSMGFPQKVSLLTHIKSKHSYKQIQNS